MRKIVRPQKFMWQNIMKLIKSEKISVSMQCIGKYNNMIFFSFNFFKILNLIIMIVADITIVMIAFYVELCIIILAFIMMMIVYGAYIISFKENTNDVKISMEGLNIE